MAAKKVSKRVTLAELKEKAAAVHENRMALARPFELKSLGVELIAPPAGDEYYRKSIGVIMRGGLLEDMDDAFARTLIKACVVDPELDDEAIDAIIANNVTDFYTLFGLCSALSQDMGQMETAGVESFLAPTDGSTST